MQVPSPVELRERLWRLQSEDSRRDTLVPAGQAVDRLDTNCREENNGIQKVRCGCLLNPEGRGIRPIPEIEIIFFTPALQILKDGNRKKELIILALQVKEEVGSFRGVLHSIVHHFILIIHGFLFCFFFFALIFKRPKVSSM